MGRANEDKKRNSDNSEKEEHSGIKCKEAEKA
jgi:hypothetical protein